MIEKSSSTCISPQGEISVMIWFSLLLSSIVRETDIAKARERIEEEKKEGVRHKDVLCKTKRLTAAILVRSGTYTIGQSVIDLLKEKQEMKEKEEQEKKERQEDKARKKHMKINN